MKKHLLFKMLAVLIVLITSNAHAWAWYNFGDNYGTTQVTIWFDNSQTQLSNIKIYFQNPDNDSWSVDYSFTQVSGSDYWYINTNYAGFKKFEIHGTPKNSSDNWGWKTSAHTDEPHSGWTARCLNPSTTSGQSGTWTVPGLTNVTYTNTTTASNVLAGSGTSVSPWIVKPGTKITVQLAGDLVDTRCSKSFKFGNGSASTTAANTLVNSAVKGTSYSMEGFTGATNSTYSSRYISAGTKYFTTAYSMSASVSGSHGTVAITSGGGYVYAGNTSFTVTASPDTGYEVDSWSITGGTKSGSGNEISVTADGDADCSVTVTFKAITYTITLDKGEDGDEDGEAQVDYMATSLSSITHATKAGWSRNGYWTSDATPVKIIEANGDLVANKSGYTDATGHWTRTTTPTTLIAHWKQTYSVTYHGNGSTGGSVPTDETEYALGDEVTVAGANTLVKTNYTFSGWKLDPDGEEADYQEDETFSITDNTDLYAHWTKTPYTITISGGTESSVVITYDQEGSATVNTPINKHFTGWSLGTGVTKAARSSLTDKTIYFTATQSSTVTANFVDIHVYIEGRFSCRSTSGGEINKHVGNVGDWSMTSKNVELTWNGSTNKYELQTYCTAAELSAKRGGNDTYIRINKCNGSDDLSSSKYMGPAADGNILREGTVVSTGNNQSLYFRSTSATGATNVVITYDPVTNKVAYYSAAETLYNVTISANKDEYGTVNPSGTKSVGCVDVPIKATTSKPYYKFKNWTTTGGASVANANSASTTVTATGTGTVTANFTTDGVIFLDKSAIRSEWSGTPYVYFYSAAYWDKDGKGSGSMSGGGVTVYGPYAMTQIGKSDIWYYDYSSTPGSGTTRQYVAFNDHSQVNKANFDYCQVIYRGDFYPGMPMLVVRNWKSYINNCSYFQEGYWRKYNDTDPGYVVKIYDGYGSATCKGTYALSSTEPGANTCTVDVKLNEGTNYFKIKGCDSTTINGVAYAGTYYRDKSNGTMNTDNCTNWLLSDEIGSNTGVLATAAGDYKFTLTLGAGQLFVSVNFPLAAGDYRLVYNGKMRTTYGSKKEHASHYIRKLKAPTVATDTIRKDTVSFFVDPATGALAPQIRLQHCSIAGYTVTWLNESPSVTLDLSSITKAGVYDFIVTQTNNKSGTHTISCAYKGAYTGDYYIRTEIAGGGWQTYKETEDNKLVYSEYSKNHSGYDYYHCHWTPTNKNVKFTIANDYSECVSDTVENDDFVTRTGANAGRLPYEASVRFMYNNATNELWRAYLNGSNEGSADYLKIQALHSSAGGGTDSIQMANGSAFPAGNRDGDTIFAKFTDLGNWVYQYELKAKEGTHYRLVSDYYFNSTHHLQYFKGKSSATWNASTTEQLIGGTGGTYQKLRLIYDYKTNNLLAAWMPDGNVGNDLAIHADMMLIRRAQNAATQLTFTSGKKISDVKTMVGAVEFYKDSIVGRVSDFSGDVIGPSGNRANRELMLYISFPFDVAVNDIYGCGDYNKEWYIQYYDGAERASKGWFKGDGTTTFWKFMDRSDTLRAGVGYSLLLDNDYFNTDNAGVWKNIADGGSVYLFFPSAKELDGSKVIKTGPAALPVPSHECTIDRTFVSESGRTVNHKFTDSHWNMMGVPLFQNETGVGIEQFIPKIESENPQDLIPFPANTGYFYEWDSLANTLSVRTTSGYTFKSMHGYMVQFTGTVGFSGSSIQPVSVVARRAKLNRDNYTLELQLLQNNKRVSRTYVELREEACDTFALNEDVYMVYTSQPADLFTLAGNYDVSANVLSENDHIIPVGVEVHKAGTYTFSMPGNFSGSVTLVDNELNTRTNLALSDYEVTLPKGVCEGRFSVEIGIRKTPTSIDVIEDGGSLKDGEAHKFIMNDQMYIIKNGVIYDAQGKRVK